MAAKIQKISGPLARQAVKKNVAAIHVSGKLTLLQRKLSNVLLLNAYDHLITKKTHVIDASTLCLMIGYNSNDTDVLKEALRGLAETTAEWDMLNDAGKHEWGISSLLSFAKLVDGICEYAYSPVLAEKLYDPKVYALINLNIQKRFSSGHGLTLYENCYRFKNTGSTGWWEIETFRRLMGVDDSEYYQNFKHLNAKIIKTAVKEVNRTSDILIEPEFKKMGRSISHIRFKIKANPQLAMFEIDDEEGVRKGEVYRELLAKGVSDRLARAWLGQHGEEFVREKLDYVKKREGEGRIQGSAAAYLRAAIRDDYVDVPEKKPSPEALAARAKLEDEREREDAERAAILAQKRARIEKLAVIAAHHETLSPTRRDADRHAFLKYLGDDEFARAQFERDGWKSVLNAGAIVEFYEDMLPELFETGEV